jgi:streptomycin 6-kinase
MLEIPAVVRNKAEALGASRWLAALPDLLSTLEHSWSLQVGAPFPDATEAYVARVLLEDATPAVLKLLIPRDDDAARHEIAVLERCAGEGCVRLLRSDAAMGALLLERLGPSLHDLGVPVGKRHEILCDTARAVWRPADGLDLTTGGEKAQLLAHWIVEWWDELERPCTRRAIDHALACAERRAAAYEPSRAVLVHGDVHEWNALSAGDGFKLVDPDGLHAEPEYDLGIIMREDPLELVCGDDPRDRAAMLAQRTGRDAEAIWEWGVVERVSTGLLGTRVGLQPVAAQMLRAAEHIAP